VTTTPRAADDATEQLVRDHLPVVGYVVHEVAGRLPGHVDRDELVSAGMAGLVAAARAYDRSTGVPFARYANTRIKGAVLDELRSMDWSSRGARRRSRELGDTEETLSARLGRTPTTAELAGELRVEVAELDRRRGERERALLSLDAFDGAVADSLPSTSTPDPEQHALAVERLGYLRASLEALPERLRAIVVGTFLEQRPMAEIAAELGVTESRVSQLRTEALALLRDAMNSQLDPQRLPASGTLGPTVTRRREALYAQVAANALAGGVVARALVPAQRRPDHDQPVARQHAAVSWTA
jgi:RNA polymerase sigma factor for flagellar operon FliA